MVTATPAPQGHCSQCGKVWTLNERQGVCQWCHKQATAQKTTTYKPHHIKSSRQRRQKQADTNGNGYQGYDDQLEGDWLTYNNVASKFVHKARPEDRDDVRHTIILNLAVAGSNNGHKPDNPSWMYRIASFTIAQYWRDYYKRVNGMDCGHCSNPQRKKCKADNLFSECPKAIRIEYLSKPILDDDGHLTELGDLIADDKATDLADWTDQRNFLLGCPQRLIDIAEKIRDGEALPKTEQKYLERYRKREQKKLF